MDEKAGRVVSSMPMLRGMQKAGLIEFNHATGKKVRHWTGQIVKAYYVNGPGPKHPEASRGRLYVSVAPFEYRKKMYRLRFLDGCFCPFVVVDDKLTRKKGFA